MKKIVAPLTVTADRLCSGEKLELGRYSLKNAKHLSFTCDLTDIGDGKILVGHGYGVSGCSWLEIDRESVCGYKFYTYTDPNTIPLFAEPVKHNIALTGTLTVVIDVNPFEQTAFFLVASSDGAVKSEIRGWDGVDGNIFASVEGCEVTNCKLNWSSDAFARRVWVLGDSYLGINNPMRWPYYLYRDGYQAHLLAGYPGMPAQNSAEEFARYVELGTPEYAVWTLGMNNADTPDGINETYLRATTEFLNICKERGITPILATVPNVPDRINSYKNEWVRASGYRYIDFARAVGGVETGSGWYKDMLFTDMVHPTSKGAQALYMQVLVDFPEIMQRSNT